jgi:hypothetical protein
MSYNTINACANDQVFLGRITACVAAEQRSSPNSVAHEIIWGVSAHSDIEGAYASALASENPNPGGDESVITDQMILSAVQAELAQLP